MLQLGTLHKATIQTLLLVGRERRLGALNVRLVNFPILRRLIPPLPVYLRLPYAIAMLLSPIVLELFLRNAPLRGSLSQFLTF